MCRVITLSRIASDRVNPLGSECFRKFFGESNKKVKFMVKDGRVRGAI
jgi:hypothetical protein